MTIHPNHHTFHNFYFLSALHNTHRELDVNPFLPLENFFVSLYPTTAWPLLFSIAILGSRKAVTALPEMSTRNVGPAASVDLSWSFGGAVDRPKLNARSPTVTNRLV